MIGHTNAFSTYRTLSQAHINFVVLVCYAVPALRADIALPIARWSNPPDHFKSNGNSKAEVANYAGKYQEELARSTLITVFSYFESYVKDVLAEIVDFHGGAKELQRLATKRATKFVASSDSDVQKYKRKLQDRPEKAKVFKYQKYGRLLEGKGFKFPTELFSCFGISQMLTKLDEARGLRAWEIPSLLEGCLLFPIAAADREHFEEVRSLRNKIGHGRPSKIALRKSLQYASILHSLAAKVDRHVVEHFLVIQAV